MYLYKSRFAIGPMSKNVVDACIEYADAYNRQLILIPSRNQVDYNGGYSNNWTTADFARYVKSKTDFIYLERDHGGPRQGAVKDDGRASLEEDCKYLDIIHLDPWKESNCLEEGCIKTANLLSFCHRLNKDIVYEVGTEQSIFPYEADGLDYILTYLHASLSTDQFEQIKFAVIQSGTALKGNSNTGHFNKDRLNDMLTVCCRHGVLSKEHNCDYLPTDLIGAKLDAGLDCINIAPEFGLIETQVYLSEVYGTELFNEFYQICLDSKKWVRWLGPKPPKDKEKLICACGHYVLSYPSFITNIKEKIGKSLDSTIRREIIRRLQILHGDTP